jgi:hypothetical protein
MNGERWVGRRADANALVLFDFMARATVFKKRCGEERHLDRSPADRAVAWPVSRS